MQKYEKLSIQPKLFGQKTGEAYKYFYLISTFPISNVSNKNLIFKHIKQPISLPHPHFNVFKVQIFYFFRIFAHTTINQNNENKAIITIIRPAGM